jgi:starvation-inducible DNA-binding protein
MNEELINTLKGLLADTVALKFKAHGYHWNVEGDDFPQFHEFFGEIYEEIDGSVDPMAEWIRMLGGYAPFKLSRFTELASIPETEVTADPVAMSTDLYMVMEILIAKFKSAGISATNSQEFGLANFFADRQTALQKHCWQLRAVIKPEMED